MSKACRVAHNVLFYTYRSGSYELRREQYRKLLQRFNNLSIFYVDPDQLLNLALPVHRNMKLQCTIHGSGCWVSDGDTSVEIKVDALLRDSAGTSRVFDGK